MPVQPGHHCEEPSALRSRYSFRHGFAWCRWCGVGLVALVASSALWAASPFADRDFSQIDQYVLAAPTPTMESPETLAHYLSQGARDDVDRARAIFRWLAENIEYDTDGFFSGHYGDLKPASVLKRRKTVCSGYTNLFTALAKLMGLNVTTIRGYAKDVAHSDGEPFEDANHDWIGIQLGDHWYLIEPTWGAGGLDDAGRFRRQFSPQYFLIEPADLADTHFAQEPRWRAPGQTTLAEFVKRIRPFAAYYQYQLGNISALDYRIQVDCSGWRVTLTTPEDVYLTTSLEQGDQHFEQQTFIQRLGGRHHILVNAPQAGEYLLRIFAKRKHEAGHQFTQALRYRLVFAQGSPFLFPVHFVTLREHAGTLISPLRSDLTLHDTVDFAIGLPTAREVSVATGNSPWVKLTRRAHGVYEGKAKISGTTLLLAKFNDSDDQYYNLASFTATSQVQPTGFTTCQPGQE